MQELLVEATELNAQSATLLPDRETLCTMGCVNVQVNLAALTSVQVPIAVSIGGNAYAIADAAIAASQTNHFSY